MSEGGEGFVPPAYPYDLLDGIRERAAELHGGVADCSVGTPVDEPPEAALRALASAESIRGYPPSIGTLAYRQAAAGWLERELGVVVDPATEIAATVGSKEFVTQTPHHLRLRRPERDTVLYPAVSYPSYAMGAALAGCRAVAVPVDDRWRIDLAAIDAADARRALCLWVNTPGNPAGGLDDLEAAAAWGRANDVLVISDECYAEFTWAGPPRTILTSGTRGVLAAHSLSKRSNLAGARAGFYAGDAEIVDYLREVRKHGGMMVPGPVQAAAAAALDDQDHVAAQRERYLQRMAVGLEIFAALGVEAALPEGGFYLWAAAPGGDAWALTAELAERAGVIVSPGEFYGPAGAGHVRFAAVQPVEALRGALDRLA